MAINFREAVVGHERADTMRELQHLMYQQNYRGKLQATLHRKNKNHRKALLMISSFHFNCHTKGFHPQTQKLEPPCTA